MSIIKRASIPVIRSTLCYLEKDGCYLMLHRVKKKGDVNHDKWIGIGGKIEPGEAPDACILRETIEETGLRIDKLLKVGTILFQSNEAPTEEMHLYRSNSFSGTLKECDEGNLEWVPVSKVMSLPQWEGDRFFLDYLKKGQTFSHMTLQYEGDRLLYAECDGKVLLERN